MTQDEKDILYDLWLYATGQDWGETTEDDAASEGDALLDLFRRVKEVLG